MEDNQVLNEAPSRNFSLDSFSKASKKMVATNDNAYSSIYQDPLRSRCLKREYTEQEILSIIDSGSLSEQQKLSRYYFHKDGYYKQILIHYATLLMYSGLLIPNPAPGKNLSTSHIQKRYYNAMDFVENMQLPTVLSNCALRALIDGTYYGVKAPTDKKSFVLIDLPSGYACSRFKDTKGNDIVEFDVSYFDKISDKEQQKTALAAYPKIVSKAYKEWSNQKRKSKWVMIPSDVGVCFPLFDGRPLFLSIIPATLEYDAAVATERERDADEIRKIIVQKIPHLTDGRLLFEPDEAEEIHSAAVGMMKGNKNLSVLTTYGDVDAIVSKTSADNTDSILSRFEQNIYAQGGTSKEIFAASGSSSLKTSLTNDLALMMHLAGKFSTYITNTINDMFANSNITFKYSILPISWHNQIDYADMAFKLVGSGYSILMPALAVGLTQRDLGNVKDMENDLLKLGEKLIPLSTSYTQSESGEDGDKTDADQDPKQGEAKPTLPQDEGGRPKKQGEDKAEQTIANEKSKEKTGGGS